MENFSFIIGRYYDDGSIGDYMFRNRTIFYGNLELAKSMLEYAQSDYSKSDWKIFKLEEVKQ